MEKIIRPQSYLVNMKFAGYEDPKEICIDKFVYISFELAKDQVHYSGTLFLFTTTRPLFPTLNYPKNVFLIPLVTKLLICLQIFGKPTSPTRLGNSVQCICLLTNSK